MSPMEPNPMQSNIANMESKLMVDLYQPICLEISHLENAWQRDKRNLVRKLHFVNEFYVFKLKKEVYL